MICHCHVCDQELRLASELFFTALLGLCLNFHMEQEGELMLHYEPSSARVAANLKQVIRLGELCVLLCPGQVEMCHRVQKPGESLTCPSWCYNLMAMPGRA